MAQQRQWWRACRRVSASSRIVNRSSSPHFQTLAKPSSFPSETTPWAASSLTSRPGFSPFHSSSFLLQRDTPTQKMASATAFYNFKPLDKRGQEVPLANYEGKVVLIINTASKCGFTPQYAGFEKLYKELKEKYDGQFEFLGFPCNQFGGQEPGSQEEIGEFCQVNYGVTFPIMQKVEVNGDNTIPLYDWLKNEKPGLMGLKRVKWNFEKFLVGRDGKVKNRWASTTKPENLKADIIAELEKKAPAAAAPAAPAAELPAEAKE